MTPEVHPDPEPTQAGNRLGEQRTQRVLVSATHRARRRESPDVEGGWRSMSTLSATATSMSGSQTPRRCPPHWDSRGRTQQNYPATHPRAPELTAHPPGPLTHGGKPISPCQPREKVTLWPQATCHGSSLTRHRSEGPGGRGKPAREEGPGGRPGRSRHKPTTGQGQITIVITFEIEAPAGGRNSERGDNKRTHRRKQHWR